MPESYLALSPKEQGQILHALAMKENIQRDALLLEKDIWICWALEFLFKMPNKLPMAFKGGTSLSKAFRAINRFSEDVDITIDYKAFDCGDPFAEDLSKTKIKNISQQLKNQVTSHIENNVLPYFKRVIGEQFVKNITNSCIR
jgi:predicted nucleotidyltransferase component of viral defense system